MSDFNSGSSVSLVLMGMLVGVLVVIAGFIGFIAWLMKNFADNMALRERVSDPQPVTTNLREAVKPELVKIQTVAKVPVGSVSVGVRKASAPTLHLGKEAEWEALQPASGLAARKRRFPGVPEYRYFVEGCPEPLGTLREALAAGFPSMPASPKCPDWARLPKGVLDKIRRELVEKVEE